MNESKIAVRYARALFELSEEKKITDTLYADILLIQELVKLDDVKILLASPVVSSLKKCDAVLAILKGKIHDTSASFISMVFKNKREIYLTSITRRFIDDYKKLKNIKTVEITTAVEMDEKTKENFRKQILKTYKADIELTTLVNPDIIGGFVVQVDDILYDASVKKQLKNIQQSLLTEKL